MSGLQNIPIRWPERYDPAFFDRLFREVLANADVRNATAGTGIVISGTPDQVATIAASEDIENLLLGGPITALDSGVPSARQLVAGDTSIIITDNGPGDTITVQVGQIQLTQLGNLPDLSVIGVPTADDGFDLPTTITALANDTVLRRTSNTLNWGQLTAGMFPDSMVTILSGTEFEIVTDQVDIHGQLRLEVQSATTALLVDGNVGDATTPLIDIINIGLNVDRMLMRFREEAALGFYLQGDFSNTDVDNRLVWGADYVGGDDEAFFIYADGRFGAASSAFFFDPDGTLNVTNTTGATGSALTATLSATGDVILILNADTDDTGGESHNPYVEFRQDGGTVIGRIGMVGVAGDDPAAAGFTGSLANGIAIHAPNASGNIVLGKQGLVSLLIDSSGNVNIINSKDFLIGVVGANNLFYDVSDATLHVRSAADALLVLEADTDNVTETDNPTFRLLQDGQLVDARIGFSGATGVDSMGSTFTGGVTNALTIHQINSSADAQIQLGVQNAIAVLIDSSNNFNVRQGRTFRILDTANTDSGAWTHNGTNLVLVMTNTTAYDMSGAAELELTGGMDLWIRDAGFLRIYDSTDTDYGQQSHDGTDYLWAFVTTRHLAFSGLTGTYTFDRPIRFRGFTVGTLPAGTTGDRAYVTDANAPTFGATVAGGGAVVIPVFYDGANWIVG